MNTAAPERRGFIEGGSGYRGKLSHAQVIDVQHAQRRGQGGVRLDRGVASISIPTKKKTYQIVGIDGRIIKNRSRSARRSRVR